MSGTCRLFAGCPHGLTMMLIIGTLAATGAGQVIFEDNFDGYANDAEMTAVWPNFGDTIAGSLATHQYLSPPKSLCHPAGPGNNRYHVFPAVIPTDVDPIIWNFNFYDEAGSGLTRKTCALLTSPNWNSQADSWIEFGLYSGVSTTHYCIRTVNLDGPNWTVYPDAVRTVGWHSMRVEVGQTYIKFRVDSLPACQVAVNATGVAFTTVACGGPSNLSSLFGGACFDDILVAGSFPHCSYVPEVDIYDILVSGLTIVNVSNVNSAATKVTVYAGTDGGTFTEIGSSTKTPFASTVPVTVWPLVTGQPITATQTMSVTIPGFPPQVIEGCIIPPGPTVDGCAQIPPVDVVGMTDAGRTAVRAGSVDPRATAVKVYAYDGDTGTTNLIGLNNAPGGQAMVNVNVTALVEGQILRATQSITGLEGCLATSGGRRVTAPGIIEDFEGTVLRYDHPAPGRSAAWYDVSYQAYTDVLIPGQNRTTMPDGSNCINITDLGWTNGAYVIYEDIVPADGEYHIELDMLVDEPEGMDTDLYNQYQVGAIVNGVHRATGGILPGIPAPIGHYPCLTSHRDAVDATGPMKVYVGSFTAVAGDDLLLAFSTDVSGYVRSKTATPAGFVGMKVDNIKLVAGPRPPACTDVPLPQVAGPLEAGQTSVSLRNVSVFATLIRIFSDGREIGRWVPGQPHLIVEPLIAGARIVASQTVEGVESCVCPGEGPVVGAARNSDLRITLGIRETGSAGGVVGPIEWVGATAKGSDGQPIGRVLAVDSDWQTIKFAWPTAGGSDPVTGFTGNGVVEGTHGVLESLNFTIDSGNTGRYVLYVDSIMSGSTVIADFDADAPGTLTMFRQPRYSGSTFMNLMDDPDVAEVDDNVAAEGGRSYRVEFQFVDDQPKRWLRLTTFDDGTTPDMPVQNPLIDLTQPVTVKILLAPAPCHDPHEDLDGDGDVDADDLIVFAAELGRLVNAPALSCLDYDYDGAVTTLDYPLWLAGYRAFIQDPGAPDPLTKFGDFQGDWHVDETDFDHFSSCAGGPNLPPGASECGDADLDHDEDVDQGDFAIFQRCLTEPDHYVNPACR